MDQSADRIPAWKKLGLKLKAANQSGDTVPGPSDTSSNGNQKGKQNAEEPHNSGIKGPNEDIHHDARPTENGKSSSLGKRKHHDTPAEDQQQSSKKSKTYEQETRHTGEPVKSKPTSLNVDSAISTTTGADNPSGIASDTKRPRGDPNYRKKKEKVKKFPSHVKGQAPEEQASLLPSTETDFPTSQHLTTPKPSKGTRLPFARDSASATLQSSPSRADRRKSVTFTPDTKTVDGDSASNFFKKWVVEQKGADAGFTPAEVAQFTPPPKTHPANGGSAPPQTVSSDQTSKAKKEKKKKSTSATETQAQPSPSLAEPAATSGGKVKDTSRYTSYLEQYFFDRENWKFNKAKQNDVIANAFNIFRIPHRYTEALVEYVKGLKGAALVDRLKESCRAVIKELDAEDEKVMGTKTDTEERELARLEALEDRVAREWKRRQTNADLENIANHPYPEGFIRRLKRRRVEALCEALKMAVPNVQTPKEIPSESKNASIEARNAVIRHTRKRKSRTEVSSDESSSSDGSSDEEVSSSSEEPSSDESEESDSDSDEEGSKNDDSE